MTLYKIPTTIVVDVADESAAEDAMMQINRGLEGGMRSMGFPHEVVAADANNFEEVTDEEAEEEGWTE